MNKATCTVAALLVCTPGLSIAQYPRLSPAVSAGCGLATGTYSIRK